MKRFEKTYLLAALFILIISGYASDKIHNVTQDGAGDGMSVSEFNALTGNYSGHTFYFSGTISTTLIFNIHGSLGNPVTIDGRAAGPCNPVETGTCVGGTTLTGGVNQLQSNSAHSRHLVFQHFNVTGEKFSFGWLSQHTPPEYIMIRRNHFHDARGMIIAFGSGSGVSTNASNITVKENRFTNYGLSLDHSGGLNFRRTNDLVIRGNRFTGHTGITKSSNYIELHFVTGALVEYNWFDPLCKTANVNMKNFAPKEHGNWDIIFRFNKSTYTAESVNNDLASLGFNYFNASGLYAYGNYLYASGGSSGKGRGAMFYDGADNINFWANILSGNQTVGIANWFVSGRGGTKRLSNLRFYNNTFYNNASNNENYYDRSGLAITDDGALDVYVKNNIFMNNRPNNTDRRQISDNSSRITQLEHNTYYHASGDPTVRRGGADRTIATLQSSLGLENDSPAGVVADPGFVNAAAGDLSLDGTHVGNGANLSGIVGTVTVQGVRYEMRWETSLHPNTDWSGQPSASKIITANQNNYGKWERGAYLFVDKTTDLHPPSNLRIINLF